MNQSESAPNPPFPGLSQWERRTYCCIKDVVYLPVPKHYYCGQWQVSLPFPIIVNLIILSSYVICLTLILPYFSRPVSIFYIIVMSVHYFLFSYSYARIIIDGPGYYPFYWPDKLETGDSTNETLDEISLIPGDESCDDFPPGGIATTVDQLQWLANRPRPNRSIFSRSGARAQTFARS